MPRVTSTERQTQNRVIKFFREELGYRYLGDWTDRAGNSNIEEEILSQYLVGAGYRKDQISRVLDVLGRESNNSNRNLYGNNQAIYSLLRYGVQVQSSPGEPTETVQLINWKSPEKNDFAIAEEVTLTGAQERRPDLVLYLNGIAVGVIELKNSRTSIGEGIRQLLSNQRREFNAWFFSTVQIVFAGNDSEGVKYGTIGTPEKYFLRWKEDEEDNTRFKLDKYLLKMCDKTRFIELIHDFIVFDAGVKKLPRVHQYFGVKAAQDHVKKRKGGIIWHTQGSGKSIVMVLLAKWILENNPSARVAIITDRDELDKQIEGVFRNSDESIVRTKSGRDLMQRLGQASPRLLCSLVHKFGRHGEADFDRFIEDLRANPIPPKGDIFVFVDECHRTQSGRLHKTMKAILSNAVFIGFTGTPLLKRDKQTSLEVFGGYIHTYKFAEAVDDRVVLDLMYEARDIDQELSSKTKIDEWFEAKTKGLNQWQKDELKRKWGTMQTVLSSKSRLHKIVTDIIHHFGTRRPLETERGNAMLVASSILEACKYYELFQETPLKGRCAIVTSYNPVAQDVTLEETGANTETDKQLIFNTYTKLLAGTPADAGRSRTEVYEDRAKKLFRDEPANMKLLIVVNKLLTGFDAPSCTYLFLDKKMQDHGLFQAICRTNRLDGDEKDFGYIVDYMDLFKKVENAISVYSGDEIDDSLGGADPRVLLQDRVQKGRERLEEALEAAFLCCEPVDKSRGELGYIHYFCGNSEVPTDREEREPLRFALYSCVVSLVRAYANIANDMDEAGYSPGDTQRIKRDVEEYVRIRDMIRRTSEEVIDLKAYEADMRYLIDTYIVASEPEKISPFDGIPLLELIVKSGISDAINQRLGGLKSNKDAVAETIQNNVRTKIVKERLADPQFYDRMSVLLDEIIKERRDGQLEYAEYLKKIAELVASVQSARADEMPASLDSPGKRALFNNTGKDEALATRLHDAVMSARPDSWRGVVAKENVVKRALYDVIGNEEEVERIFEIIKAQREY